MNVTNVRACSDSAAPAPEAEAGEAEDLAELLAEGELLLQGIGELDGGGGGGGRAPRSRGRPPRPPSARGPGVPAGSEGARDPAGSGSPAVHRSSGGAGDITKVSELYQVRAPPPLGQGMDTRARAYSTKHSAHTHAGMLHLSGCPSVEPQCIRLNSLQRAFVQGPATLTFPAEAAI